MSSKSKKKEAGAGAGDVEKRPDASKSQRPAVALGTLITDNLKSIVAALITAVIGAFGFWLSPLREVVAHKIYSERAAILLATDSARVLEGDTVHLRVIVTPQSAVHIDKGVLRISFDQRLLHLRAGETTFASPVIDGPIVLPERNPMEFLAISPGNAEIQVQLETKYGTYAAKSKVVIEELHVTDEATRENFTGSWHLRLGSSRGKMEIRQQRAVAITGSYYLDDGDKGVIDGGRDGDRFWGSFTRGSSVTKWVVEAGIVTNQGYLELKGNAYLQRASENGWARVSPDSEFYATVAVR